MPVSDAAKDAARDATTSTVFRVLARSGFAANGVVHILIGGIILAVATGTRAEADQVGAFKAIATAPLGFVALWVVAIALWALALWHVADGLLARGHRPRKWGARVSEWSQALVFAGLGAVAAAVALGARPNAEETAEDASRGVLAIPGGVFLLGAVGAGFAVAGVVFVVMGLRRTFRNKVTIPHSGPGRSLAGLGAIGFVAKGVALGIIGILLLVAAVKVDPGAAGGLDGAVDGLLEFPFGRVLAGIVGVGLIAYGVFCIFRARYARL